jgi:hypothetical protein
MKLNPTVREFLDKYPGLTMLGLAWAIYWRIQLAIMIVMAAIAILFTVLSAIFAGLSGS